MSPEQPWKEAVPTGDGKVKVVDAEQAPSLQESGMATPDEKLPPPANKESTSQHGSFAEGAGQGALGYDSPPVEGGYSRSTGKRDNRPTLAHEYGNEDK